MINRPILIITIGYLIGIIIGLYCKISIAFFVVPNLLYLILKNKLRKHKKQINNNTTKIVITKNESIFSNKVCHYYNIFKLNNVLNIILISALISNSIVLALNYSYENKYKNVEESTFVATIFSEPKVKDYYVQYKIRIENINNESKYKNTYLYLNIKDNTLKYGYKVKFSGKFVEPDIQRNYKGFNYKQYLKSIGIYGTVKADNAEIIGKGKVSSIKLLANKVSNYIKLIMEKNIENEDNKNLLLAILLGKDEKLKTEIKENFQDSNLSHILAVSGMHVSYVILGITLLLNKCKISKKLIKIATIILLIFFIFLTGEAPSVKRACIMAIYQIRCKFNI